MQVTLTTQDDVHVADLSGILDMQAKESFDELLHPIVAAGGGRLLINLSEVPRINSAGIGQLVTLVSRANTKGSRVVLTQLSPFVLSVMRTTKLTRFFDLTDSKEEALKILVAPQ